MFHAISNGKNIFFITQTIHFTMKKIDLFQKAEVIASNQLTSITGGFSKSDDNGESWYNDNGTSLYDDNGNSFTDDNGSSNHDDNGNSQENDNMN